MKRVRVAVALTFSAELAARIDGLRRVFAPSTVARIVPHVTLVPPHERDATGVKTLFATIAKTVEGLHTPSLALRGVEVFANRRATAYLAVEDRDRWCERVARSLGWPATRDFVPHVTIAQDRRRELLEGLRELAAGYREQLDARSITLLLARVGDRRRHWRPILSARLAQSWVVRRSHLTLRLVVSEGAWSLALSPGGFEPLQRSVFALCDDDVVGVVSAARQSEAAWVLSDARVFDPELRGWGIGTTLVERLASAIAPAALVAPAGTHLLERVGAANVPRSLRAALGLSHEINWIALSLAS